MFEDSALYNAALGRSAHLCELQLLQIDNLRLHLVLWRTTLVL